MFTDLTYAKATAAAEHLKAIGLQSIHLYREYGFDDVPWHLAIKCKPGDSHRLGISTGVDFTAYDPKTELTFTWSMDIEPLSASGSSVYQIDVELCKRVAAKLQGPARTQFIEYLTDCTRKVQQRGFEYQQVADRQIAAAAVLRTLVSGIQ